MVVFIVQNLNEIIDNAPSMLYKKEFAITPYGGAFLKNPEPAKAYVKEKLDRLLKTYRAAIYCSTQRFDSGQTNFGKTARKPGSKIYYRSGRDIPDGLGIYQCNDPLR